MNSCAILNTYHLFLQFYLEPREYLQEALREKEVPLEDFVTLNHGESLIVEILAQVKHSRV